ncbi:MAG: hypothetical protein IJ303_02970 [Clostridia bacterium]|nr:hypothetical protein [Clostridia bacterium]
MQKTRMGISVGLLAAVIYFSGFFAGFLTTTLLAGYVLLFEENGWLRRNTIKAFVLMIIFMLASAIIGFIPNLLDFIYDIVVLFNGSFSYLKVSQFLSIITDILSIAEKVLFLVLGFMALNQRSVNLPVIDNLINKYTA